MQRQTQAPPEETLPREQRLARAVADWNRFPGLLQVRTKSASGRAEDSKRIQMVLTPLQRRFNAVRSGRDVVLKPRQVFFTTLEAARDVWWFLTRPGAHVVVVCQSQTDQAALKDISEKFRIFFDSLKRIGLKLEFGRESNTEWTLPKRDATLRIIQAGASEVAAQRKGRGGTVNRLHLSEMAFWGDYAEQTFLSLTESVPMEGAEIVNESTANGAGGFYFDQWSASGDGRSVYRQHFVAWYDHHEYRRPLAPGEVFEARSEKERALLAKGVQPEQILWRRWKIADKGGNERLVDQEYPNDPESCFLLSGTCFFDIEQVQLEILKATTPVAIEEHDALRIWARPEAGKQYVLSADPASGEVDPDAPEDEKLDPSAGIILERGTGRHVATIHGQFIPWDLGDLLAKVGAMYNNATIAPERNDRGISVIDCLRRKHKYRNVYVHQDNKHGWLTSPTSRPLMLDALDASHRKGEFQTPDAALLGEMRTFVNGKSGKPQAAKGKHDDLVMAAAIAWAVTTRSSRHAKARAVVAPVVNWEDRSAGFE